MAPNKIPITNEGSEDDRTLLPFLNDLLDVANVSDQPPVVQIAIGTTGGMYALKKLYFKNTMF